MNRIVVVGETNVDVVLRAQGPAVAGQEVLATDSVITLGSASAICAMGLARLGNRVTFFSRVGADVWGDYCLGILDAAGIDTTHVRRDDRVKTGVTVSIAAAGDRALVTHPGSVETVTEPEVPDVALDGAAHLHVSSFFLQRALRPDCARLFARARAARLSTSLDPGFDPSQHWVDLRGVIGAVDVLLPNERELLAVTGQTEIAAALRTLEPTGTLVVVKAGTAGAMVVENGNVLRVRACAAPAVDTTGAGDSFNAGFLDAFVRGRPLVECLAAGNACGALSTRALGGIAAQPTREEVDGLVRSLLEEP
jgi:sugar/nucleoside kinase (ribokinase family)